MLVSGPGSAQLPPTRWGALRVTQGHHENAENLKPGSITSLEKCAHVIAQKYKQKTKHVRITTSAKTRLSQHRPCHISKKSLNARRFFRSTRKTLRLPNVPKSIASQSKSTFRPQGALSAARMTDLPAAQGSKIIPQRDKVDVPSLPSDSFCTKTEVQPLRKSHNNMRATNRNLNEQIQASQHTF